MIIPSIVGLIKRILLNEIPLYKNESILSSIEKFWKNINFKVGLSNYATKTVLKEATGIDTCSFALKSNLASLKTEVGKLDIDKLVPVSVDLNKQSDIAKNDIDKKSALAAVENKIPDVRSVVKKTDYNTKN